MEKSEVPENIAAVFFDLGDTLGTPVISAPPVHLSGFNVFSFAPVLLQLLRDRGLRLGIISNTGPDGHDRVNPVLEQAGLLGFFEPELCIYSKDVGHTKAETAIFAIAVDRAGLSQEPQRCLFVGEDQSERNVARTAGMRVSPDPQAVPAMLGQA
jgi:leucyl aminopeptidase